MPPKRKRPRTEKLQQYGIDLPDIPGLPIVVIPLHVQALKAATQFFGDYKEEAVPCDETVEQQQPNTALPLSNSLVESILERVDETAAAVDDNERRRRRDVLEAKKQAVEGWLEAIHRQIVDTKDSTIATAAVQHLWGLTKSHKRLTVRRAALFLAAQLLRKSAHARRWLLDDEQPPLLEWMDGLVGDEEARLLQREGFCMLRMLHRSGYSDLYPILPVAVQRLQQMLPIATDVSLTSSAATSMTTWRQARDLALAHYAEEARRVDKLVQRAHAAMDVLVPRLGAEATTAEDGHDEEEDVDWEDGYEDEVNNVEDHAAAVERTMAVMETIRGINGGSIEISMQDGAQIESTGALDPLKAAAREKLKNVVEILASRHMPRLSGWAAGLTNADSLQSSDGNEARLVSLPLKTNQLRKAVLLRVIALKASVASVLAAAKRIGLDSIDPSGVVVTESAEPRQAHIAVNLATNASRHQHLSAAMRRQLPNGQRQARRIQVKFNKR